MINNTRVSQTDTHKCLGVQIDEKLEDRYIDMISCKKASAGIGAMRRIRPFAPSNSLEKVCRSYKNVIKTSELHFLSSAKWQNKK